MRYYQMFPFIFKFFNLIIQEIIKIFFLLPYIYHILIQTIFCNHADLYEITKAVDGLTKLKCRRTRKKEGQNY